MRNMRLGYQVLFCSNNCPVLQIVIFLWMEETAIQERVSEWGLAMDAMGDQGGVCYSQYMSYLLDQTDQYYEEMAMEESEKSSTCGDACPKETAQQGMDRRAIQEMCRVGGNRVRMWESVRQVSWWVVVGEASGGLLQTMRCDRATGQWSNRMVLLEGYSNFLKMHNRQRIILMQLELLKRTSDHHLLKLSISPHSGCVTLVLSPLLITADPQRKHVLNYFLHETRAVCDKFKDLIAYIRQLGHFFTQAPPVGQSEQVNKLKTLMRRFGTHLAFTGSDEVQNDFAMEQKYERESKISLISNQVALGEREGKTLELFVDNIEAMRVVVQQQLQFQFLEKQEIKYKIKMPGLSKCRNIYENNAILNYIKINNPHLMKNRLKPVNQGGFSKIYSLEVDYWYVYSGSNNEVVANTQEPRFSRESMFKKLMVVKRDLPNNTKIIRQRVAHEKEILKQIKNGNALFLPKYYIVTDECEIKEDLLVDYIFQPNMVDFVFLTRISLSLNSKIYLLFMLTQALRFISVYGIVHLDLKPANLMISRTLLIKIIDFGESYHPDVCTPEHAPGFTMPYSSPESYYPKGYFDQKNDVFSLGVIAYELLYGRYPFFLSNPATRSQAYRNSDYSNHWFYNPQELLSYGEHHVFPLLQLIIARCLHPNPSLRPSLDWLCIILRECLDYYYF